ncbi:hypothetical protein HN51_005147, partial [Arachis hypogaea]
MKQKWHLIKEGKEEDVNRVHHHQGERSKPSKELQPKAKEETISFLLSDSLEFFSLAKDRPLFVNFQKK